MCIGILTACGGDEEETTVAKNDATQAETNNSESESVIETEAKYVPEISVKNYGEQLYMQYFGYESFYGKFLWIEESDESLLGEAVYQRQIDLYEHLGVELIATPTVGFHGYYDPFMTSVKNKDGAVDLFLPNYYLGVAQMINEGYFYKFNDIPEFNLDAEYWNIGFMDSISIWDDYYLGYGDFNVMKAYVVTFNKDMLDKYSDSLDETLYESVYNYRWTIDRMISLANLVYIDASADGKTADDTFGFYAHQWEPFIPFLQASGIKLVDVNDAGEYKVSVMNELNAYKTSALVDKLKGLAESDCAWLRYKSELDTPDVPLYTGRSLMNLQKTAEIDSLLSYDLRFGVLPYPMYDENQKDMGYISLNYDSYITLPSYLRNYDMIVESVELLNYYSADVRTAVFDKWLGKQAADEPDDAKMLDIVWDGICSDFGLTFSTITLELDKNLYMLPTLTEAGTDQAIGSYVASYTKSANGAIDKYMKKMKMK